MPPADLCSITGSVTPSIGAIGIHLVRSQPSVTGEFVMLVRKTARERGKPLDKAFTDEEIVAMYIAEH